MDNKRISVTQKQSVRDAIALVNAGKSAAEVKEILEREALQSSIYVMVDTLKYLKKGGELVYSTCSIIYEENEKIVEEFLKENKDFSYMDINLENQVNVVKEIKKTSYIQLYPSRETDGFFICKLMKK